MYAIGKDGVIKSKTKKVVTSPDQQTTITFKQINLFGKQVIDKMIKGNVPPTPVNYSIYFEKLIDDKPQAQRKNITNILELEEVESYDHVSKLENSIQDSFAQVKTMMNSISSVYSKTNKLITITKEKRDELTKNSDKLALVSYDEDLQSISQDLAKHQKSIKDQYTNVASIIKNFNSESIFDKKYDVYNKKYLFTAIESEKKSIKNFKHSSMLLALQINSNSLNSIRLARDKELITKTVGKMILKRSRRNDIIAHFEDGVFMILLKHTDEEHANITIDRIDNMISLSNYIVDSQSIEIELNFALSKIIPNKTKEQIVALALDKLPNR